MNIEVTTANLIGKERATKVLRDESRILNHFARGPVSTWNGSTLVWHGNTMGVPIRSRRACLELRPDDVHLSVSFDFPRSMRAHLQRAAVEAHLEAHLQGLFGVPVEPRDHKVFCIGFQRTGTTSILDALRLLGYFGIHDAPWLLAGIQAGDVDWPFFDDYDAFADNPFPLIFRELDERFPGSKFILTERDTDAWLSSAQFLVQEWVAGFEMERHIYGTDTFDASVYRERYERHGREVREHFAGRRDDLLVLDITAREPWKPLCDFLAVPTPEARFPRSGSSRAGQGRLESLWARVRMTA